MARRIYGVTRYGDTDEAYERGLADAAAIADFYARENFRLAGDTVLLDPVLSGRDRSPAGHAISQQCRTDGCIFSSMAHAAQNIAAEIRSKADE